MDNEERKKSIRECASSNAGGAIGGMLGAAIGSFINPMLSFPGSFIGTPLGAVLGLKLCQLDTPFVKNLLKKKLLSDFSKSFIIDKFTLHDEIEKFEVRMKRNPDIYSNFHPYFTNNEVWEFRNDLDISQEIELLLDLGEISINVSSLNTGVIATLMSLNERYGQYGLCINIDHSCVNGIQQIQAINHNPSQKYDFLISPSDTFALSPGKGTFAYRSLGPINSHTQCTFRKNSLTDFREKSIYTFENSSAEMQYLLKIKIPDEVKGKEPVPSNTNILGVLNDMGGGDYIIVWEPFASILRTKKEFQEIERCRYEVVFHLFARDCWYKSDLARERIAFKRLFQNEWRRCCGDRGRSLHLLQQDYAYLANFAKGSDLIKQ